MKRSSNPSDEWWEEKTGTLQSGHAARAEVFLRSLTPAVGACQQQEGVLEQLQTLEQQGLFETVDCNVWGKSVCPDSAAAQTGPGRRILDHIDEFSSWAARIDEPIEMPFEETAVSCSITDEQYQKVVLPQICLAVYAGEELELVLPCEVDGDCYGVAEFVSSIERRNPIEQGLGTSA